MEATNTESNANDTNDWAAVAALSEEKDIEARTTIVVRLVSVPLTQEQRAGKADELAALVDEIHVAKNYLKEEAARLRDAVKDLERKQAQVAEEVKSGTGQVEVECKRIPVDGQNAWRYVRVDTGEVVDEEPMTAEDRQGYLPFGPADDDEDISLGDAPEEAPNASPEDAGDDEIGIEADAEIDDPEALLGAMGDLADVELVNCGPANVGVLPKTRRGRGKKK